MKFLFLWNFLFFDSCFGIILKKKLAKIDGNFAFTDQVGPDDGRSISRKKASLNMLVHDVINLLY